MHGIWEMNVLIIPQRSTLSAWCRAITSPHVGRITPLIPPFFATCYNLGDVLEKLRDIERSVSLPPTKTGDSTLVLHRVFLWFMCLHHIVSDYFAIISVAQLPVVFLLKVAWCHIMFMVLCFYRLEFR